MSSSPIIPLPAEKISRVLFWMIVAALAGLATWANLDLTGQRASLFMDEMIPFDNVKRILTADSPTALVWAVSDGGDHRYGRIFYNSSAAASWLPYLLWGDSGLIIALRCTQVAMLLGAIILFCQALLRTWTTRTLALLAIACLPFTDYYLTQPKPEPVQLLSYALFIGCALRRQFAFGWHWLFLGLAFGAKISAAPFCACAGLLGIAHIWVYSVGWRRAISSGIVGGIAFIAGWILAIPMLAVPTKARLESYLNWTFKATGHGSDDSRISIFDWLKSLLSGGAVVHGAYPQWVAITIIATLSALLVLASVYFCWRRTTCRDFLEIHQGWLVLGLAASLLIPIMLAVKRLWGLYLFPGQLLAIVALAGITEQFLSANEIPRWLRLARQAVISTLVGATILTCYFCGKSALREYGHLAHRTSETPYLKNIAIYKSVIDELSVLVTEYKKLSGGPLEVLYDPFLFPPESTPDMNIQPFWAATIYWEHNPAVIVLGRQWHLSYFLHEKPLPASTSASFSALQTAVEQFAAHVEFDSKATPAKPYQLVRWFGEDAALVLRKDVAERWRSSVQKSSVQSRPLNQEPNQTLK